MTIQQQTEAYRQANEKRAAIVLQDQDKHGGEEALLVIWARAVMAKAGKAKEAGRKGPEVISE